MTATAVENPTAVLERLASAHGISYCAGLPPGPQQLRTPDGLALNFIDWGGTGPPILFLHGGALTAHTWDLVCLALRDVFRCVAIDLRGHGGSAWADDYTIEAYVGDVSTVVAHFGWTSVHLVGMSLGGNIAAHYAASANAGVASLTMVDVGPEVDFDSTALMRNFVDRPIDDLALDQLVEAAVRASSHGGYDKILYRYLHMTRIGADGRLAWRQDRRRPRDYAHLLGKLAELNELAGGITCKVLIARGGQSRVLTNEKVAAFATRFRDARCVSIPEAGHNIQEDNPAALVIALRDFLS